MQLLLYLLACILYFVGLSWGSYLGFWLCVEAAGLVLISGFFSYYVDTNRYVALLNYLLVSGISSSFIFVGLLSNVFNTLILLGCFIKSGLFPFMGWVLAVYSNCSWFLLYILAVVGKAIFLYLPMVSVSWVESFDLLVMLSLLFSGAWLWSVASNVKFYFCLTSISSSATYLYIVLHNNIELSVSLFVFYLVYNTCNFLVFYMLDSGSSFSHTNVLYLFVLISVPFSISFLYKLVSTYVISGFSLYICLAWILYGISEQLFLCNVIMEKSCIN
uniref:NADH dehydrogenase subunit 2 n=1 Tax=Enterogyrus malmbergi TaxID=2593014 RepID=A0A6M3R5J9_9PLAT|nr:NADH dehydrogenase subunit 2 [Enterogyrus malmbergi]QJD07094.1 NADH dehydrogenase subunit 2 [Enterogyrus malmbergi]